MKWTPHWSFTPPKEESADSSTDRFPEFRTPDKKFRRNGTQIKWELSPVPTLSYVQNGGPVDIVTIASSQCKALFGLFPLNSNKSVLLSALLTVDG